MVFKRRSRAGADPQTSSTRESILAELTPWVESQTRLAWRPVTSEGEPRELASSKFGGESVLAADEPIPTCRLCGRPLQLFLQVNLATIPKKSIGTFGDDVLQLFYCIGQPIGSEPDGHPECFADGGWEPFSHDAKLVRVIPAETLTRREPSPEFAASTVVEWQPFDDLPDPEDHAAAGLLATYDHKAATVTYRCPELGVEATLGITELEAEAISRAAEKDKLSGWPYWVQGAEYPRCLTCQSEMRPVVQIDSQDHVPYMFGDSGVGHIMQCPEHHGVVAFGWACM